MAELYLDTTIKVEAIFKLFEGRHYVITVIGETLGIILYKSQSFPNYGF
jgi:hypothetical protein